VTTGPTSLRTSCPRPILFITMRRRSLLLGLLLACIALALTGCFDRPHPTAVLSSAIISGPAPLDVSFNLSYSEIPTGELVQYTLEFGDGSDPGTGSDLDIAVHHTYESGGTYVAELLIQDTDGRIAIDHQTITVSQDGPPVGPEVGMTAPDFTAHTTDGGEVTLAELRGNVILLDFWGAWCTPCKKSMPRLDTFAQTYEAAGLVVVLISTDPDEQTSIDYLANRGYNDFISVWEAGGRYTPVAQLYGVLSGGDVGIPHTFLIDRQGVIRFAGHPVEDLSESAIEALL